MPTEAEIQREFSLILELTRDDPHTAFQMLERQLGVLVLRTQVLLSLCGIVVTVTGFSGRTIAQTSTVARTLVAGGIVVVLLAAVVSIWGVLRLQWLTQIPAKDWRELLVEGLRIRYRKSRFLAAALVLFIGGFSCYVLAIALMLLATKPL